MKGMTQVGSMDDPRWSSVQDKGVGWHKLVPCPCKEQGKECKSWEAKMDYSGFPEDDEGRGPLNYDKLVGFDKASEEEPVELETLVEATVPEAAPFTEAYQRFMIVASRNKDRDADRQRASFIFADSDIVKIFLHGEEIEVDAHQLVRAISAVTGQQFGNF